MSKALLKYTQGTVLDMFSRPPSFTATTRDTTAVQCSPVQCNKVFSPKCVCNCFNNQPIAMHAYFAVFFLLWRRDETETRRHLKIWKRILQPVPSFFPIPTLPAQHQPKAQPSPAVTLSTLPPTQLAKAASTAPRLISIVYHADSHRALHLPKIKSWNKNTGW